MRHLILIGMSLILMFNAAIAAKKTYSLKSGEVITRPDGGATRVLWKLDRPLGLTDAIIGHASLSFPLGGDVESRKLRCRVYAVSKDWVDGAADWNAGWTRAGGDVHEKLYANATLEFDRSGARATFDVTNLIKEVAETDLESFGFLLTMAPAERDGFESRDLGRFQRISEGKFTVTYRGIPSKRPESRN